MPSRPPCLHGPLQLPWTVPATPGLLQQHLRPASGHSIAAGARDGYVSLSFRGPQWVLLCKEEPAAVPPWAVVGGREDLRWLKRSPDHVPTGQSPAGLLQIISPKLPLCL